MKLIKQASMLCAAFIAIAAPGADKKPNILVIWGDDVGWENVSAYGLGIMGNVRSPNIDRIGREGIIFTSQYGQPSCTAGRVSFITGQYPIRSGMTTVGQPGDKLGIQAESPCLAEVLKQAGYRTGQFGKNHLGDHNPSLPTVHGFDEFYGNLYHLNVSEQFEQLDYTNFAMAYSGSMDAYLKKFGARGVLHCFATDKNDPTVDGRFGLIGKQTIEDTGPLTIERMKTFDDEEVVPRALKFMKDSKEQGKPFFVWLNPTRMHLYTHLTDKWRDAAAKISSQWDIHGSGMMEHDRDIGTVLDFLKANGLEENTIVWYSTDNGPEHASWPYGATTPFHGEKMTTYEGGVRVPSLLRWPGVIKSGQTLDGIQAHMDMFTTLAAAAGVPDVNAQVMAEKKQYIDGVNNLDYWTGKTTESNRKALFYYYEDKLTAIRMGPWKIHFSTKENYYSNLIPLTFPLVFNLKADPFESYSDELGAAGHLAQQISWITSPMREILRDHLMTLGKYPPVQGSKSLSMANIVEEFLDRNHD